MQFLFYTPFIHLRAYCNQQKTFLQTPYHVDTSEKNLMEEMSMIECIMVSSSSSTSGSHDDSHAFWHQCTSNDLWVF